MGKIDKKYKHAIIATDVAVFTIENRLLKILLTKMENPPYRGRWAMLGGLVKPDEPVNEAAKRHLRDKLDLKHSHLEQLYTFGDVNRDPSGRIVSVAYFSLISRNRIFLAQGKGKNRLSLVPVGQLPQMAYDHKKIARYAIDRIRKKIEYTNIVYSLLPDEFTFTELQKTYESILDKKLDKRNFRKRISALNIIEKTDNKTVGQAHRPATLFRFVEKEPRIVQMLK